MLTATDICSLIANFLYCVLSAAFYQSKFKLKNKTMKALFKGKLVSTGEWVEGTYHYSNDGKYHYILNRECFLERTYDTGNEMALKKEEVHLVDGNTVIQIDEDACL